MTSVQVATLVSSTTSTKRRRDEHLFLGPESSWLSGAVVAVVVAVVAAVMPVVAPARGPVSLSGSCSAPMAVLPCSVSAAQTSAGERAAGAPSAWNRCLPARITASSGSLRLTPQDRAPNSMRARNFESCAMRIGRP